MARAISRIKAVTFLEFDYFHDESGEFSLARTLREIHWADLISLSSIAFYDCNLGQATLSALLEVIKVNKHIVSITGRNVVLGDDIVAALATNTALSRELTAPPFVAFDDCVAYTERWPIMLMNNDTSVVRVDFFGPVDGDLHLEIAHRNERRASILQVETGNKRPVQRPVTLSSIFTNDSSTLLPGVHFESGRRNTLWIRASDTGHEIRSVQLLDEFGLPYTSSSESMSIEKQVSIDIFSRRGGLRLQ
jgi:hypothetical protein